MKDIIIEYQLISDRTWKRITLSPEDYFDEDEKGYSIDSIEKFYLEPRNYILEDQNKIKFLNFYISDEEGHEVITKFTYWGNGDNQILDSCKYENGSLVYRTIINSVKVQNNATLILRVEEIDKQLVPITHSITDLNDDYIQKNDLSLFKKTMTEEQ